MKAHPKVLEQALKDMGYKFLGWQNLWKHVYFDKNGDETEGNPGENPRVSFGYSKADHPEYSNCLESKHKVDDVQCNGRGSENIVSCDQCKMYWKYDCSD